MCAFSSPFDFNKLLFHTYKQENWNGKNNTGRKKSQRIDVIGSRNGSSLFYQEGKQPKANMCEHQHDLLPSRPSYLAMIYDDFICSSCSKQIFISQENIVSNVILYLLAVMRLTAPNWTEIVFHKSFGWRRIRKKKIQT